MRGRPVVWPVLLDELVGRTEMNFAEALPPQPSQRGGIDIGDCHETRSVLGFRLMTGATGRAVTIDLQGGEMPPNA